MKLVAKITSIIFHPVVFSLVLPYTLVFRHSHNAIYALKWMVFSSIFLFLALFLFFLSRPKEFFSDFDIAKREKRQLFYAIVCISGILYLCAALFIKGPSFPLSIVAIGIVLSCVLLEICNRFVKVSIHTSVAVAFVVSMGLLYGWGVFFSLFIVIPGIIWSRLTLQKHTPIEVIVGILVGIVVTFITFGIGLVLV